MALKTIDPEIRRRAAALGAEMRRIHALPDRWLAAELLRLARRIRERTSYAERIEHDTYNSSLLWDVVPDLARRLGADVLPNENVDPRLKRLDGDDLRGFVAICLANTTRGYMKEADDGADLNPLDVLLHETANGNPVIIALDRVAPPTMASNDPAAAHLRYVSRVRGHEPTASWRPELSVMAKTEEDVPEMGYGT